MVRIGVDTPPRKGADFRQALDRENGAEQPNHFRFALHGAQDDTDRPAITVQAPCPMRPTVIGLVPLPILQLVVFLKGWVERTETHRFAFRGQNGSDVSFEICRWHRN